MKNPNIFNLPEGHFAEVNPADRTLRIYKTAGAFPEDTTILADFRITEEKFIDLIDFFASMTGPKILPSRLHLSEDQVGEIGINLIAGKTYDNIQISEPQDPANFSPDTVGGVNSGESSGSVLTVSESAEPAKLPNSEAVVEHPAEDVAGINRLEKSIHQIARAQPGEITEAEAVELLRAEPGTAVLINAGFLTADDISQNDIHAVGLKLAEGIIKYRHANGAYTEIVATALDVDVGKTEGVEANVFNIQAAKEINAGYESHTGIYVAPLPKGIDAGYNEEVGVFVSPDIHKSLIDSATNNDSVKGALGEQG